MGVSPRDSGVARRNSRGDAQRTALDHHCERNFARQQGNGPRFGRGRSIVRKTGVGACKTPRASDGGGRGTFLSPRSRGRKTPTPNAPVRVRTGTVGTSCGSQKRSRSSAIPAFPVLPNPRGIGESPGSVGLPPFTRSGWSRGRGRTVRRWPRRSIAAIALPGPISDRRPSGPRSPGRLSRTGA